MNRIYCITLVLLILIGICTPVIGQYKIVQVDSVTRSADQPLPFDERFTLKIPTHSPRVTLLAYVKHVGRKSLAQSVRIKERWPLLYGPSIYNVPKDNYSLQRIAGQPYIVANFVGPKGLLEPGKNYTFFWAEDVDDDVMELFDRYDSSRVTQSRTALPAMLKKYKEIAVRNQKVFDTVLQTYSISDSTGKVVTSLYADLKLTNYYDSLRRRQNTYDKQLRGLSLTQYPPGSTALKLLIQLIINRSTDIDTPLRLAYLPDIPKATANLDRLARLDNLTWLRLLKGEVTLDCDGCSPTALTHYEVRQSNLKTTTDTIEKLLRFAVIIASSHNAIEPAVKWLRSFRADLQTMAKPLDSLVDIRTNMKGKIFRNGGGLLQTLSGTSNVSSFETRTKFSIVPDFGVVTTRFTRRFVGDQANDYPFVPYLGVAINFRPINRDVPFKSYKHTFLHRTSLLLGWSLVSVDNGPKLAHSQAVDSVASFFTKGKGTLLAGLGYRIGGIARITAGSMLYFQFPQDSNTPGLYNRRELRAWPFVGLSVDLTLKDLFNGITDVFSGSPRRYTPPPSPTTD